MAPPPSAPPGNVCNGKFLLELIDDSAIFAGLFILIGVCLHAWTAVSAMPSRTMAGRAMTASRDSGLSQAKEEITMDDITVQKPEESQQSLSAAGASSAAGDADTTKRLAELEAQVQRLIQREGRDQGLLGGKRKGRRATADASAKSLGRFLPKKSKAKPSTAAPGAADQPIVSVETMSA